MKISFNGKVNIIESLEKIIDFLKEHAASFDQTQMGLHLYFNLQRSNGVEFPGNRDEYVYMSKAQGFESKTDIGAREAKDACKKQMVDELYQELCWGEELDKQIEHARKQCDAAAKRGFKTKDKWLNEMNRLKEEKATILPQKVKVMLMLQKCIDAGIVYWHIRVNQQAFPGKKFRKLTTYYVLPIIDKSCTVCPKPIYFYGGSFLGDTPKFTYDYVKDVRKWFSFTKEE